MPIALFAPSGQEWLWILLAAAVIFGAARLPQIMRGFGQGIREFKSAVKENEEKSPDAPADANGSAPKAS